MSERATATFIAAKHSPIAAMVAALTKPPPAPPQIVLTPGTRTDQIRQLLRQGRFTSPAIAGYVSLARPALVGALLKADILAGRVLFCDGCYEWNHDLDDETAEEIKAAAQLLRKHGYQVSRKRIE